ncbi:hypothetical protein M2459_000964 [Parabacteroides sp. PF5-5]|uniref:hypothetical protein n=1 Tax=unclassified Parabacteroides TaxID=2649774 RepID=UPI002473A9F1|nr:MULTISPECIES: hypothetical protein [unclassified Parabacteroides]MDH6304236.1 hypothetical protein [Parabacteroides sp. PH5-39]MDH6315049.1 hypothetical protein [Parabacteroides sp. PF5-13]MDH6318709.1 hypothetical protein [Parabacteroides sp. PH5-13]MDH6322439.1 hypothetical protein [Parabacteroides sp. PH5-8]MDH6326426.1 hypothetical protein [Parabacteroides sp. PH5-41]
MEKDTNQVFRELKNDTIKYAELKFELFKLSTYEGTGKVSAVLSYGLILTLLAFFALLFIFLSAGFFLGELFNSLGMGFGCIAIVYMILIWIIIANRHKIRRKVMNEVIAALTANEDKNNDDTKETDPSGEAVS